MIQIYWTAKETHIFTLSFYLIESNDILLLLSKQIFLCMAIRFAAFSCCKAISRKNMLIFVKKRPKSQNSCSLYQDSNFQFNFAACEFSKMHVEILLVQTPKIFFSACSNYQKNDLYENKLMFKLLVLKSKNIRDWETESSNINGWCLFHVKLSINVIKIAVTG